MISEEHARLLEALDHVESTSTPHSTSLPPGCGVKRSIPTCHLDSLLSLSDDIIAQVRDMAPWSEGMQDERKRCYGFVSEFSKWESVQQLCDAGIVLDAEPETIGEGGNDSNRHDQAGNNNNNGTSQLSQKHHFTVDKCCTTVSLTKASREAIEYLIAEAHSILEANIDHLEPYELQSLSMTNLAAIQPNVHNHSDFLPLHLDQPRHDGFGVVILTVGLTGAGEIILVDDGDDTDDNDNNETDKVVSAGGPWAFPLLAGDMYVLSGPARNLCRHGVVMLTDSGNKTNRGITTKQRVNTSTTQERTPSDSTEEVDRVSLNLRFGVHTPQQAYESVDRHWT